jgi:hypothetical protein
MKQISIIAEKTRTEYSAYVENYPVYTAACNFEELKSNILEALTFYFEHAKGMKFIPNRGIKNNYVLAIKNERREVISGINVMLIKRVQAR